jgi:hypothetical protein
LDLPEVRVQQQPEDILRIFAEACALVGVRCTFAPRAVYVSRKADVAILDAFIGPKA